MNEAIVRVFAWEWFPFVHMCNFSVTVPQHVPLLLCQCSQSSVRVCFWAPAMLLGHCVWEAACRHLSVPFSQRVCVCEDSEEGEGHHDHKWWVMPEVVQLPSSLQACWLTNGLWRGLGERLAASRWVLLFLIWYPSLGEGGGWAVDGEGGADTPCLHSRSGGRCTRVPWSKHRSLEDSERAAESSLYDCQLNKRHTFTLGFMFVYII